jgi:hypothetical protein
MRERTAEIRKLEGEAAYRGIKYYEAMLMTHYDYLNYSQIVAEVL